MSRCTPAAPPCRPPRGGRSTHLPKTEVHGRARVPLAAQDMHVRLGPNPLTLTRGVFDDEWAFDDCMRVGQLSGGALRSPFIIGVCVTELELFS